MTWQERITTNPAQCGGRPCIRGMRIRVKDVLDLLAAGLSHAEIVSELPDLQVEVCPVNRPEQVSFNVNDRLLSTAVLFLPSER